MRDLFSSVRRRNILSKTLNLGYHLDYTHRVPADNAYRVIRNQLNYILINKRFRNTVLSAKTYPGANIRMTIVNIQRLKQDKLKEETTDELVDKINDISEDHNDKEEIWSQFKNSVALTTINQLIENEKNTEKQWMTSEILQLMEERRKFKNNDTDKYNELHRKIVK